MTRKYTKKGPERPQQVTMSIPKLQGPNQLRELVHAYGGPERMVEDLKISRELLDRWCADDGNPPFHFLVAAYFIGPYGMSHAFSESHWTHQYNSFLKNRALDQVKMLENVVRACSQVLGMDHPALAPPLKFALASPEDDIGTWRQRDLTFTQAVPIADQARA